MSTEPEVDRLQLIVPARARYGAVVRLLAASLAADQGFSVDEIDDVRLAVSEAFSLLVEQCAGQGSIVTAVVAQEGSIDAELFAEPPVDGLAVDALAATILASVTDSWSTDGGVIRIAKAAVELAR